MRASVLPSRIQRQTSEQRPLIPRTRGTPHSPPPQRRDSASGTDEEDLYDEDRSVSDASARRQQDEEHAAAALLPIFSAPHLDRIPIYHLQHSIRVLVVQKCETTLSWDQLRSPQISQFLVKPVQQQIQASHLSRGTLYALLANCLQFQKEGQMNPGSVGVLRTRALICELLAMRLLKDSSTRELIDAVFYDFDPLQGVSPPATGTATPRLRNPTRISAVEIAIRAQAKRFLAHPLVVQQLEAVWAGKIVFHSAADTLHRRPSKQGGQQSGQYGTMEGQSSSRALKQRSGPPAFIPKMQESWTPGVRRSVSLYNPADASLFKLSRLRVPRYRQLFSTLSYAIMLGLFLAVLIQRSLDITALELIFWFWSAGFLLDELVGFNEQGFGLYIMSVWNAFDIGILLLFVAYYVLRLYGILMPDVRKRDMANMAYDVLASTAVLLFPRLFSVLDHYRYFSQLLIAFRMMAVDLAAILILIVISCSGFFVAFTLSFSDKDFNAAAAAYALFQIVMGFTPAAWDMWPDYNLLGKSILVVFLIICHFLIVTILITVLTNSFMAIVQNANEEHQFLFAVNTISLVKSDALFSYVPPTNILGWLLAPMRYVLDFRQFVRLNRSIIKVTHMPILFAICAYERVFLGREAFEPIDLVEQRGRQPRRLTAFSVRGGADLFSPGVRLREPSVTTFHKDRALEEVFRRPFQETLLNRARGRDDSTLQRTKSTNVVDDWMRGVGQAAASPMEQPRSAIDHLETRRIPLRRHKTSGPVPVRWASALMSPSAVSNPDDARSRYYRTIHEEDAFSISRDDLPQQTDQDGDDELATNDDDERNTADRSSNETFTQDDPSKINRAQTHDASDTDDDYFRSHSTAKARTPMINAAIKRQIKSPERSPVQSAPPQNKPLASHARNVSSATILFSPVQPLQDDDEIVPSRSTASPAKPNLLADRSSGTATPRRGGGGGGGAAAAAGKRPQPSSSLTFVQPSRPRPIMPSRADMKSTPNLTTFLAMDRRKPSFSARALDLASELGDNRIVPDFHGGFPASLGTHVDFTNQGRRGVRAYDYEGRESGDGDTSRRLNKLVLARMSTLEEGFREVLREVKGLSRGGRSAGDSMPGSAPGSLPDVRNFGSTRRKPHGKGKARRVPGNGFGHGVSISAAAGAQDFGGDVVEGFVERSSL